MNKIFAAVFIFALASFQLAAQAAPKPHPNILYILVDDLGYGDISSLNPQNKIKTPQLDRFITRSLVFTEAHSSSAVCTPSRYTIITGRYNWRSKLKSSLLFGFSPPLIEKGRLTVAQMLHDQGYQTAAMGKWHLGLEWQRLANPPPHSPQNPGAAIDFTKPIGGGPITLGFDYFFGISGSLDMAPYTFIENDHVVELPTNLTGFLMGEDGKRTRIGPQAPSFKAVEVLPRLTQHAIDYIDRHAGSAREGKPFFLYLAFPTPHTPLVPNEQWRGKSGLNVYADYVMETDDYIGKVLAALDRDGLTTNTLIVFASDNGCSPEVDFPFLLSHGHNPSAGRRGFKADIYDGGHRVPMIVSWPGHVTPGTRTADFVCLGDFMATCADILGIELPPNAAEDSISFLPLLRDQNATPPRDTLVESSVDGSFGIRQGQWKLAFCPGSGGWSYPRPDRVNTASWPRFQLFDVVADPQEKTNLFGQDQQMVNRLGHLMREYILNGRSTPGAAQQNDSVKKWQQIAWIDEFKSNDLGTGIIPPDQPQ